MFKGGSDRLRRTEWIYARETGEMEEEDDAHVMQLVSGEGERD